MIAAQTVGESIRNNWILTTTLIQLSLHHASFCECLMILFYAKPPTTIQVYFAFPSNVVE